MNLFSDNNGTTDCSSRPSKATIGIDVWAYTFLGSMFAFRMVYGYYLGLIPDETYYWDWSRELSFGYFDHPPMIAWIIFLSRLVFGETALGVRSAAIACSLGASVFSYLLAKKYVTKPSSLMFLLVLSNGILLFGVGTLLATPDVPLILFWTSSLYFGYRAVFEKSNSAWLALGLCAGFGLLSKYTFGLFFIALALFLVLSKSQRHWLRRWQPYCAAAIAMVTWLPNLVWNARHGWVSFLFQFSHGISSHGSLRFDSLGEFVAGQIGILSLFPFVLLVCALALSFRKIRSNSREGYLAIFFYVPFCVFFLASLQKKVEANWAATAYVSGLIVIAVYWEKAGRRMKRFAVFSTAFAALTTAAVLFHIQVPFLPLAPANDPATQVRGWKEWAHDVNTIRNSLDYAGALPICANRYQEASMLGFYLPDHPKTYSLCLGARENTYGIFTKRKPSAFEKIIFIHPFDDPVSGPLYENAFLSLNQRAVVALRQGKRSLSLYNLYFAVTRKPL